MSDPIITDAPEPTDAERARAEEVLNLPDGVGVLDRDADVLELVPDGSRAVKPAEADAR